MTSIDGFARCALRLSRGALDGLLRRDLDVFRGRLIDEWRRILQRADDDDRAVAVPRFTRRFSRLPGRDLLFHRAGDGVGKRAVLREQN